MIRIVLAHPSKLVCDLLRKVLNAEEDVYLVGVANTLEELNFLLPYTNIVLLSKKLDRENTINALRDFQRKFQEIKFLLLGFDEEPDVIMKYIEAGADGYILEDESVEQMLSKIRAANEDEALVSPPVTALLIDRVTQLANTEGHLASVKARNSMVEGLTSREEEVLELVAEGCTNKEIAGELYIECGTVKNHVHNILSKMDVNSRHEASSIYRTEIHPSAEAISA